MRRVPFVLCSAALASLLFEAPKARSAEPSPVASSPRTPGKAPRWTDRTPDGMVRLARARLLDPSTSEAERWAALLLLPRLSERTSHGLAQSTLRDVASASSLSQDLRAEAALLAMADSGEPSSASQLEALHRWGVVTDLFLLGPFRDNGGGLDRHEGPEAPGASFADGKANHSWGSVTVQWRRIPPAYAKPNGIPLDLFVHPRRESCSYVAANLTLKAPETAVVRVAAAGQVRLSFDGVDMARSDDVHADAMVDRLAARVEASAGTHLVSLKVCTSALDDTGRVRLRITNEKGVSLVTSTSTTPDPADTVHPKAFSVAGAEAKKAKATEVVTPLRQALAPEKGSDGALLAAILLRTLGGADDSRSPRAPGLLDTLFRRNTLTPDAMALGAWVAPSGADRSGYMNLARSQAAAQGDDATKDFCERRLAAEHLRAGMPDWALSTTRDLAPPPSTVDVSDQESRLLPALIVQALGAEALQFRAYMELLRVAMAAKGATTTGLLGEWAAAAEGLNPPQFLEARKLLAQRGDRGSAYVQALTLLGRDAVVPAARRAFEGDLVNADDGLAVARNTADSGAHDAAAGMYARLAEWSPNRAEVWAGLAAEIGATKGPALAIEKALQRARELDPSEPRYRDELALRQTNKGRPPEAEDERYLVPAATLLARRQGVPTKGAPDVSERQLHWLRAVVLHPDRRVSQLLHYAREIVIAPRSQDELYENLPAEGDRTEILRARVFRRDGTVAYPAEEHNDGTRPRIRWPELSPGDTVEVALRAWTQRPVGGRGDPPFYFVDYAGSRTTQPLLYNEVIVEHPKAQPIYVDMPHGAADVRNEKDEGDKHILRLVWNHPVAVPDEPLAPALSEVVPVVAGSTYRTWGEFRQWYSEAVRGFTDPDDKVLRLAEELTRGKKTRDEKVSALFRFVADDIRYVNYVSGEFWLPNRPQQVIARREGDCDDKAILLIALLKAVGVTAEEVLVQTRMTGEPSLLKAKGVAIPRFDHGIAFLPTPTGGLYLDATSPQSRMGYFPAMDARAVALRMDGPAEIVELPPGSPDDHGADVKWTIQLDGDGAAQLTGEERHAGDSSFWARTYLSEPGARREYVEHSLLAGWFPSVAVEDAIEFDGELPKGKAWVKYRARSQGFARREDGERVVPLARSTTFTSELAPLVERTLPVALPPMLAPSHENRETKIVAPKGATWLDLPSGGEENGGEFGRASLEIRREEGQPRVVWVKRSVVFDQSRIPVEKYGAWRAWLQRVDGLMNKKLRYTLTPAGPTKAAR